MFEKYINFIQNQYFTLSQDRLPTELLIEEDGNLSVYYAPFDYINTDAKIVICGITPGFQQAILALKEAGKQLRLGATLETAKLAAKNTASFGGPMRSNLIRLLDYIGISQKLDIVSCSELFGSKSNLVHYTSALRYPVFKSHKNYSGTPSMVSKPILRKQLENCLFPELKQLSSSTLFVPLGPKVEEALSLAVKAGFVNQDKVLGGLPHPSGANAERIAYFLGDKPANELSAKTNPIKIDAAKEKVMAKVACA
ncbi:MAG: hypothetical protein N0E54_03200 [Candidatus Thiodiazotropha taylori]|nr:hypothetical protein [Candidatus Thiodiazotropha endolucinida]MCW4227734.1 hypothetical protein [Candidatus Thiodiazotropha taylori]